MVLLAFRLYWMGNKPPNFSNSDNPAADSPSLLTRTLTFLYLPAVNAWLLLCPDRLSFDWSMDALPLVRSLADWRNLHTVVFYLALLVLGWFGLGLPLRPSAASSSRGGKESNGRAHFPAVSNGKLAATNGNGYHGSDQDHGSSENEHPPGVENGTKKPPTTTTQTASAVAPPRTSLPTTENVLVFSLGMMAVPFLPATNLFFYVGFVVAERVLYIPSMGFCLLVAVAMRALYVRLPRRSSKSLVLYFGATLVVLFGIKTVLRNQDWQNEEMLYRSGITVNPAKGKIGIWLTLHLPQSLSIWLAYLVIIDVL